MIFTRKGLLPTWEKDRESEMCNFLAEVSLVSIILTFNFMPPRISPFLLLYSK